MENKMKVFEAFSGYGSQSISLRDCGIEHEVIGISEIEPDAIIAYGAIRFDINKLHTDKTHDEMRKELMDKNVGKDFKTGKSKIPRMKKDKLEMLYKFDKAINNFGDISIIKPNDLPDFDYMTYSFPCTDISVSGKMEGIEKGKTRSGLLYECEKVIETKRPKYLLMENVKNLVGKKFRKQFDEWCKYLESLGYTNYHNNYKCLNAKDFQIAQNRERIFMFSVLGEHNEFKFPQGEKLTKRLKDFLEENVDDKYYLSEEIQKRFKQTKKDDGKNNIIGTTAPEFRTIGQRDLVYSQEGTMGALVATDYKQPKQIIEKSDRLGGCFDDEKGKHQAGSVWNKEGLCPTLDTMQGGYRQPLVIDENVNVLVTHRDEEPKIIVEGNTNLSNHNATRVLSTEGISCTIMENHGKVVQILEHNIICEQRSDEGLRFFKGNICGTIRTINSGGDKRVIETEPNFRIRKLTPKECLRLMGLSDEDITKMQSVGLSDSALYKLAGNSIVKQCLDALHINMFK